MTSNPADRTPAVDTSAAVTMNEICRLGGSSNLWDHWCRSSLTVHTTLRPQAGRWPAYVECAQHRRGEIVLDEYRKVTKAAFVAENARTRVTPGDVLLTIVGSVGRVAVVPRAAQPFCLQRSVAVIDTAGLDSAFLARQLSNLHRSRDNWKKSPPAQLRKASTLGHSSELALVVPPIDEQRRIVEKVDALFARAIARERLTLARESLECFRQSVLAAACSGRLTEGSRSAPRAGRIKSPPGVGCCPAKALGRTGEPATHGSPIEVQACAPACTA